MANGGQLFSDGWLPVGACLYLHEVNYTTKFGNMQVFFIFVTGRIIPAFYFVWSVSTFAFFMLQAAILSRSCCSKNSFRYFFSKGKGFVKRESLSLILHELHENI